jgi:hypothetical protein
VEIRESWVLQVAELLFPMLVARLKGTSRKKESLQSGDNECIKHLSAWLAAAIPKSVLNDHDGLELLGYCCDLLKDRSSTDLAVILGIPGTDSMTELGSKPFQAPLYLPHIDVPSSSVYHQLQTAVATKGFTRFDGTPFPTTVLETRDVRGQAQLKPLILDTLGTTQPQHEEQLIKLMWQQREELSDLDCDVWDYCNWKWLMRAVTPEEYAIIRIEEILEMRGIMKKLNGAGQRGGYKRAQRVAVQKSIVHLQNVWLNLFEFKVYDNRHSRSQRSPSESIQDRAFRIRESGQITLEGEFQVHTFAFRPGIIFSPFLFGPGRQVALLAAKALTYKPKSEKYEKRLARYFSWQWRINASRAEYLQPYRVSTLLRAITLSANERFPDRTRSRFEGALDRLMNDHLIRTWQYEHDRTEHNTYTWLGDWLGTC